MHLNSFDHSISSKNTDSSSKMGSLSHVGIDLDSLARLIAHQVPLPRLRQAEFLRHRSLRELVTARINGSNPKDWQAVREQLENWTSREKHIVGYYDRGYPRLLRESARPPVALFVQGQRDSLSRPMVAIVGSRRASYEACEWTRGLAHDLVQLGWCVSSGLARGIDAAAHEGALLGSGLTVAVLGCGIDVVYPPEHRSLYRQIAASGALVSEFPPATPPRAWHFPNRNRILAALSRGVLVVQAEKKSGALITAQHALEENREVMAVPGDVQDPRSRGSHRLLKEGAALVEDAGDVLEALAHVEVGAPHQVPKGGLGGKDESTHQEVAPGVNRELAAALRRPRHESELQSILGWSVPQLQATLAQLELSGILERDFRGRIRLR